MADDTYAVRIKGGAVGFISANAIWTMPAASPTATPIRQAMLYEPSASESLRGDSIGCPSVEDFPLCAGARTCPRAAPTDAMGQSADRGQAARRPLHAP